MKTGSLNGQGIAELQNFNIQNLSSAPTTNLKKGRLYFDTTDNTLYVYDGTQWVDALSQGIIYQEGGGIDITNATISIDIATGNNVGNVVLTTTNGLAGNVDLSGKIDKLTTSPTSGTYTKVTINSDGLVTNGTTLSSTDIPNLSLSKITDVTATASEVNVLDGITASTAELNIMDGVTVTATDINSVTSKIGLTDLSIDSGSTNYLDYNNTSGKISAKVDTIVTASSSKLVTSGAVATAINNAMTGGMVYKGVWTATGQTDYSSITLPVKAGYMYLVSGSATIGGIEWNTDDYLVINADVAVGGTITDVKKIDNTEGSDIVRLNATQTLTNKTIDADDNTISDLTTSNFKSGVITTSIGATGSDTSIPTEKSVRTAINALSYSVQNTALTQSGGKCSFVVTHNLNTTTPKTDLYEVATGEKVMYDVAITSANVVTYTILSETNIAADTYLAVVQK